MAAVRTPGDHSKSAAASSGRGAPAMRAYRASTAAAAVRCEIREAWATTPGSQRVKTSHT
jgi:hypothetical protein